MQVTQRVFLLLRQNAHYLFEHDGIARKILIASQPGNPYIAQLYRKPF